LSATGKTKLFDYSANFEKLNRK